MNSSTGRTRPASPLTRPVTRTTGPAPRLPWPPLLALGTATLVMVTAEMLPTAVLVPMSEGLGVAESRIGQLVAAWALTVVVASIPLTRVTRRLDRRALILTGLAVVAASSFVTATSPTYEIAFAARLAGAAAVGLLWATANAHVADLVPGEILGPAVAVLLGGATFGLVLGTPAARLVADLWGWRSAFAMLGAGALLTLALVRWTVPAQPRKVPEVRAVDGVRAPLTPILAVTGLVGMLLVGFYGTYTFITRLGEPAAGIVPGGMSGLLLAFGVASALGVAAAGRVRGHATWLAVAGAATALALFALHWADRSPVGVAVVIGLGLVTGALPPLAQTEILQRAGEAHRDLAAVLIPVVFNGGIAVGAAVASLLVAQHGTWALPGPAALTAAVAALGLWVVRRRPGP
ncbi:MFS transporter [Ornithinimicrobium cavernae]|uniref:MFS transporter n=1 Tax=Ornithinimicrobium cavernae TaxID=2666047 RepID=UPI000D69A7F1|nr:MFS transporter [Ornithinimicrobium cavernae]